MYWLGRSSGPVRLLRVGVGRSVVYLISDLLADVLHGVLPRCPVTLVPPGIIVGLSSPHGEDAPSAFEICARLVEARRRAGAMLPRVAARTNTWPKVSNMWVSRRFHDSAPPYT